ncbi:MAG: hypothetical protein RL322_2051 [Pseudomonadota bacterium]
MSPIEAVTAPAQAVDPELRDAGVCGPELAHLGSLYCDSPRALVFRTPSPDWRLMLLILPWASRLSLLGNPIFASLARQWGLGVRFIGIDRDHLVYDFRALLAERTLALLIDLMRACEPGALHRDARWLDVLFDALASQMLTTLERRRSDWSRHLDRTHRLESGVATSLFSQQERHPDFSARLRQALREGTIDANFYGRVLRSVDRREAEVDARLNAIVIHHLDPATLTQLSFARAGQHLGCYNWLRLAPRYAPARAHLLQRLPWMADFLAETLVPLEATRFFGGTDAEPGEAPQETIVRPPDPPPVNPNALKPDSTIDDSLGQAIDGGQDRTIIETLALRLRVNPAVLRRLWREAPRALGTPAAWLLPTLVQQLAERPERQWPQADEDWQALIEHASDRVLAA